MQFPIDLEQYDRREQLKKSGLGKVWFPLIMRLICFLTGLKYPLKYMYRIDNLDSFVCVGRSLCFYQNLMKKSV